MNKPENNKHIHFKWQYCGLQTSVGTIH